VGSASRGLALDAGGGAQGRGAGGGTVRIARPSMTWGPVPPVSVVSTAIGAAG
jgi:hypothetical protein